MPNITPEGSADSQCSSKCEQIEVVQSERKILPDTDIDFKIEEASVTPKEVMTSQILINMSQMKWLKMRIKVSQIQICPHKLKKLIGILNVR